MIRNLRNDGTFPGYPTGALLVRRGSVGHVRDVGTFLQDQLIYTVHFLDADRLVGCREEELQPADAPWVETRFEFRDRVQATRMLAVGGEIVVAAGGVGQVTRVLRDAPEGVAYEVLFDDRVLRVPEPALAEVAPPPPSDAGDTDHEPARSRS